MTTKTDEQEREAFEAACIKHAEEAGYDEEAVILTRNGDEYVYKLTRAAWWGYQAGRAALQSQDREDAAYEAGWRNAALWADRGDLIADIGSAEYERDRDAARAAKEPS